MSADTIADVYRYAYRIADVLRLPITEPILRAYINAVRRANAIYWAEWASGDALAQPDPHADDDPSADTDY